MKTRPTDRSMSRGWHAVQCFVEQRRLRINRAKWTVVPDDVALLISSRWPSLPASAAGILWTLTILSPVAWRGVRRARRIAAALAVGALLVAFPGPASAAPTAHLTYTVGIDPSGTAHIIEDWRLSDIADGQRLTRRLQCRPVAGAWPLRMRLFDARIESEGETLSASTRHRATAGDCAIDLPPLPASGRLRISYALSGYAVAGHPDGGWVAAHRVFQAPWPGITTFDLRAGLPNPLTDGDIEGFRFDADYRLATWDQTKSNGGGAAFDVRLEAKDTATPPTSLSFVMRSSAGDVVLPSGRAFAAELWEQCGVGGQIGLVLLVLSLFLRWLPAPILVRVATGYLAAILALASAAFFGEARYIAADLNIDGNFGAPGAVSLGHALIEGILIVAAAHSLRRIGGERARFFVTPLPAIAVTLWHAASVAIMNDPSYAGAPLAALGFLVLWLKPAVARWHGIGLMKILANLAERGRLTFDEVEGILKIPVARAIALFRIFPSATFVIDDEARAIIDPATLKLRRDFAVCAGCGCGTQLKGRGLAACPACGRHYAWAVGAHEGAKEASRVRHPDAVVYTRALLGLASLPVLALLAHVNAAYLAQVLTTAEGASRFFPQWAVGTVVLGAACGTLLVARHRIGRRKAYRAFRIVSRIAPFVAADSPAARLFFFPSIEHIIADAIRRAGSVRIGELGRHLGGSDEEGLEVVLTLIQQRRLDCIFDRQKGTIIAKEFFIAASDTCRPCGGVLGIIQERVVCLYCGSTTDGSLTAVGTG